LDLTIKDISALLSLSEKEIKRLINKKEIPFHKINDDLHFNKQHIVEWALGQNIPLNLSRSEKMQEYMIKSISDLLLPDSFFYCVDFSSEFYIEQMVNMLNFDKDLDKDIVVHLLKSREELMTTAIGNGISLPHPRIPLSIGKERPLINFFFPEQELNLKSLDGKPVHTIILLISQTIRQHLSLLAHLSFLLSNENLRTAFKERRDYKTIIEMIGTIESARSE